MARPMARLGFDGLAGGHRHVLEAGAGEEAGEGGGEDAGRLARRRRRRRVQVGALDEEEPDADEAEEAEHLDDADAVADARRRLEPDDVDDAKKATTSVTTREQHRQAVAAADEKRGVDGEAARHAGVAEQRRDHRDPADREADHRPERLDGVAIGSARAIGARRRLGEAERDERAQAAHGQPRQRRLPARPSLQRRRQEEDARADDAVDAEAETIEQRQLTRGPGHARHTTRRSEIGSATAGRSLTDLL